MSVCRECSLKKGVSISARSNEVVDHCYSLIVVYIFTHRTLFGYGRKSGRENTYTHMLGFQFLHTGVSKVLFCLKVPLGGFCRIFVYA